MQIKKLDCDFSICKLRDCSKINLEAEYCFIGKTDEEISLVCPSDGVPENATVRDDNWKAFKVQGVLDFALVGVLSKISTLLAENGIPIFALSTYNTDYIFTKKQHFKKALEVLSASGYETV